MGRRQTGRINRRKKGRRESVCERERERHRERERNIERERDGVRETSKET